MPSIGNAALCVDWRGRVREREVKLHLFATFRRDAQPFAWIGVVERANARTAAGFQVPHIKVPGLFIFAPGVEAPGQGWDGNSGGRRSGRSGGRAATIQEGDRHPKLRRPGLDAPDHLNGRLDGGITADPDLVHHLAALAFHGERRLAANELHQGGGKRVPFECMNQTVQHSPRDKPSRRGTEHERDNADSSAGDLNGPRSLCADFLDELGGLLGNSSQSLVNNSDRASLD
ncbi:hypothetical protein AK812_SmicGene35775 [Symbiodinium microadriaticum]|uniref:Uncharacterized protein n=1 Tax=Symbiodinium microadriaticum TaxID=2951 RepID=A0A1Q9CKK3_SYMMI|nr:hypothetical protein AK812_SmicGene35775 [Symbiodinium microadriaticum]